MSRIKYFSSFTGFSHLQYEDEHFYIFEINSLSVASFAIGASLVAQRLKRLPAMRETWIQSLGREDPLEEGMITHSCTLAWKILWTENPGGLQSVGSQSQTLSD